MVIINCFFLSHFLKSTHVWKPTANFYQQKFQIERTSCPGLTNGSHQAMCYIILHMQILIVTTTLGDRYNVHFANE